jgi:hypothetical protein
LDTNSSASIAAPEMFFLNASEVTNVEYSQRRDRKVGWISFAVFLAVVALIATFSNDSGGPIILITLAFLIVGGIFALVRQHQYAAIAAVLEAEAQAQMIGNAVAQAIAQERAQTPVQPVVTQTPVQPVDRAAWARRS